MCKKIIFSFLSLYWIGSVFAFAGDNIMKIHDITATAGDVITVELEIINEDEFVGFNLDIPLPPEFTYVEGTSALHRDVDHFFSFDIVDDNTVRMMSASLTVTPFVGNDGVVASFDLKTPVTAGTHTLDILNAVIVSSDVENILTGVIPGTVTLEPREYLLTLLVDPEMAGAVEADPDQDYYTVDDVVELRALAHEGYLFDGWGGDTEHLDDALAAETTLTMPAGDVELTAAFVLQDYSLTVYTDPEESGDVDKDPEQEAYNMGEVVELRALAHEGYLFDGWDGDTEHLDDALAAETTLTMPAGDVELTAAFVLQDYSLTVYADPEGSGDVDKDPEQEAYNMGEVVELRAIAHEGYLFDGWDGDTEHLDDALAAETTLTMPAGDISLTANFVTDDTGIVETGFLGFRLFPNPAKYTLFVVSEGPLISEATVIDLLGQVIYRQSVQDHRHEINVSGFRTGNYFIRITTAEKVQTQRMQVIR